MAGIALSQLGWSIPDFWAASPLELRWLKDYQPGQLQPSQLAALKQLLEK